MRHDRRRQPRCGQRADHPGADEKLGRASDPRASDHCASDHRASDPRASGQRAARRVRRYHEHRVVEDFERTARTAGGRGAFSPGMDRTLAGGTEGSGQPARAGTGWHGVVAGGDDDVDGQNGIVRRGGRPAGCSA